MQDRGQAGFLQQDSSHSQVLLFIAGQPLSANFNLESQHLIKPCSGIHTKLIAKVILKEEKLTS